MKYRKGFVSNSSSSSFLALIEHDVYGIIFDYEQEVKLEEFIIENENLISKNENLKNLFEDINGCAFLILNQDKQNVFKMFDLDIYRSDKYDTIDIVGKEFIDMKPDQTMSEFKEEVKGNLEKIFGSDIRCQMIFPKVIDDDDDY